MTILSKIDVFSSFSVNLGPLYVERVLDCLVGQRQRRHLTCIPDEQRYLLYLEYLKSLPLKGSKAKSGMIHFYLGHFSQQLFMHEEALNFYEHYLAVNIRSDESKYYGLWQAALLKEKLGHPWAKAEVLLLKAHAVDLCRGESIKEIIRHYSEDRNWHLAYSYSYVATKQFFDRNPIAIRRWFVDFDAYNWKVLDSHFRICYKLHRHREASDTYQTMLRYKQKHLDELQNIEVRQMNSLAKVIVRQNKNFAMDKI